MLPVRGWLLAAIASGTLACSGSPTTPTSTLQLSSSVYTLTTTLDSNWCVATGQPPASVLSVRSMPQRDGSDWTFRSLDQPEASFELRIAGTATGSTWQLNGFIRGKIATSTAPAVTVDFGKLGVITGSTDGRQATGEITGQVRFADEQGNALTCTNVRWAFIRE